MDLTPLLRAHGYLRVERPPELWEAEIDDVLLVRAIGEMIAAALARGTELGDVVLRASNVTVQSEDSSEGEGGSVTVFLRRANRPGSVEPAERAAGSDQPKV
jgi:hypothetical protein